MTAVREEEPKESPGSGNGHLDSLSDDAPAPMAFTATTPSAEWQHIVENGDELFYETGTFKGKTYRHVYDNHPDVVSKLHKEKKLSKD